MKSFTEDSLIEQLARSSGDRHTLCRVLSTPGSVHRLQGKLDDAKDALNESLTLARKLGDVTRELFALNRLAGVSFQVDLAETERLLTSVHTLAVAVGNREREMTALNNLGPVAKERNEYERARDCFRQAVSLAREIGAQDMVALCLLNTAAIEIALGNLSARVGLREGLAGITDWCFPMGVASGNAICRTRPR